MNFDLRSVIGMAVNTIKSPREGAELMLSLGIPRAALGPALGLVVVISIIFAHINEIILPMPEFDGPRITPMILGLLQFSILMVTALSIYWIGRMFGGTGRFDEALLLVIWLQFIMVCLQVLQTAVILISASIATMIGVAGLAIFLFLLTHFIAVLHGFKSLTQVFAMIIATAFGLVVGFSILLALIGVNLPGTV